MSWGDYFKRAGRYVYDRTCDGVVAGLNWAGRVAGLGAGMLSAGSFAINEAVAAGYYATGLIKVTFNVTLTLLNLNESFKFKYDYSKPVNEQGLWGVDVDGDGGFDPNTLRMYALMALSSAVVLTSLASTIGLYIRSHRERSHFQKEKNIDISLPSWKEYGYDIAKSNLGLLTSALTSHAVTLSILRFSNLLSKTRQVTYPSSSEKNVCTPDYCGPVKHVVEHVNETINTETNVTIFGVKEPVGININVNGTGDGNVGGGVSISERQVADSSTIPIAAGMASLTGLGYCFFDKKERIAYADRLMKAGKQLDVYDESFDSSDSDRPLLIV